MLTINKLKNILYITSIAVIVSCSTKKNTFASRYWHAKNAKYNTIYNGDVALQKGMEELKSTYSDNFWELLPVERMQIEEETALPGQKAKNPNFTRAEDKAVRAIQKHSINIGGKESNMQMDEAHLLLGKARYYDKRFIPALEAFNYILYKYSNSDKIYEAKVWREKTNVRLENDALAVKNLQLLLKKYDLKPQVKSDANAILAQAYINLDDNSKAVQALKIAVETTPGKEERARYHFILGQLYQSLNHADSAYVSFQNVIDMKRKSPRMYVIQAHAKQAGLIDMTKDTLAFIEKYTKLIEDRENRPHLDALNHQVALFYDKLKQKDKAVKYYNRSLKAGSNDSYLMASNYRNLATIYFDKSKYEVAGKYYDSTLTRFPKKNREYFIIEKKRKNLDDVIKYEGIARTNDSILNVVALSPADRKSFYEDYIKQLKKKDSIQEVKEKQKKEKEAQANQTGVNDVVFDPNKPLTPGSRGVINPPSGFDNGKESFYFYTPATVSYGKVEFAKRWGKRTLGDNWRWSSQSQNVKTQEAVTDNVQSQETKEDVSLAEKYTPEFYLSKLPTSQASLDSLAKDRNLAYYQLGLIYKEKFFENKLAEDRFETVLMNKPEERLILPSKYNLFKLYEISNPAKAEALKADIIANYPNTRYAQLLTGQISESEGLAQTPEEVYKTTYKQFENQEYAPALATIEKCLTQFSGDGLIPKFELLKASAIGKLKGLEEYKKAINYVASTYPDTKEAQQADDILRVSIPRLEQMVISSDTTSTKWNVLYKAGKKEDAATTALMQKIEKYIKEKQYDKFSVSYDVYNETDNFVVIHGISSREFAQYFIELLRDTKGYNIKAPATVISSENYSVVQVRKNFDQYLQLKI
ncbi:tetratricopeptide repeat protein [Flavobacterium sp. H122]|uniref:type IX secretion system periplasmic lipoprotein PorW/SprE n=1 Tax=Flavobacterium sp. H122 TaxID=2529860 RepID=UPI0010A9E30B|nr:tetratricopeptide repeat protein [Flavobacterium sp. H122]